MATAKLFFEYWALAFVTLSLAVVLMDLYYRLIDFDLDLRGPRKEAIIALMSSAVQGSGFWLSASLFNGDAFRRINAIPALIVALIYWATHFKDWSGYEVGGIAYFQAWILTTGLLLYHQEVKMAIIFFGLFLLGLIVIAGVAKSL
jgi:hypothetical protein